MLGGMGPGGVRLSRRGVVAGGLAVAAAAGTATLVEYDVLPGRTRLHRLLGLNGPHGSVPDVAPGPVEQGRFGAALGGAEWRIAYPPEAGAGPALPVVLVLHQAGSSASRVFERLALPQFLAASRLPLVLAAVDGGAHSYWHPRADGSDAGRVVLEGLLPLLRDRGLQVESPGLAGWSMGGAGALTLATRLRRSGVTPGPVLAVSPALWTSFADTSRGAYDDRHDFEQVLADQRANRGAAVRIDCGTGDPFYRTVRSWAEELGIRGEFEAGGHDADYWQRVLPDQLAWLGGRLGLAAAVAP